MDSDFHEENWRCQGLEYLHSIQNDETCREGSNAVSMMKSNLGCHKLKSSPGLEES